MSWHLKDWLKAAGVLGGVALGAEFLPGLLAPEAAAGWTTGAGESLGGGLGEAFGMGGADAAGLSMADAAEAGLLPAQEAVAGGFLPNPGPVESAKIAVRNAVGGTQNYNKLLGMGKSFGKAAKAAQVMGLLNDHPQPVPAISPSGASGNYAPSAQLAFPDAFGQGAQGSSYYPLAEILRQRQLLLG